MDNRDYALIVQLKEKMQRLRNISPKEFGEIVSMEKKIIRLEEDISAYEELIDDLVDHKYKDFSDYILREAKKCRDWHHTKGMKVAWMPPMSIGVASIIIREARRFGIVEGDEG